MNFQNLWTYFYDCMLYYMITFKFLKNQISIVSISESVAFKISLKTSLKICCIYYYYLFILQIWFSKYLYSPFFFFTKMSEIFRYKHSIFCFTEAQPNYSSLIRRSNTLLYKLLQLADRPLTSWWWTFKSQITASCKY